jgi:tetratricopeptide (TPR) repeat protein
MEKYRIRLKNGRVMGPFEIESFGELYLKGHIKGSEEVQVFPTGDWKPIKSYRDIIQVLKKAKNSTKVEENTEATFIKKISDLKKELEEEKEAIDEPKEVVEQKTDENFPNEFQFEKKTQVTEHIAQVESKEEINKEDVAVIEDESINTEVEEEADKTEVEEKIEETEDNDATVLANPPTEDVGDKTQINKDTLKYLEQLRREEAEKKKLEEEEEKNKEPEIDLDNDSTQMVNLKDLKKELKVEAKSSENELQQIERLEQKKKKKKELEEAKRKALEEEEEDEDEEEEEENKPKLLKLVVVIAIVAFGYALLFPDEGKKKVKKIVPIYPEISFPQQYDVPNAKKAKELYIKGMKLYVSHKYPNYLQAIKFFKASVENQFKKNPAMAKLIMSYSMLLPNSKDKIENGNKIFKLVQINMSKVYKDANMAAAVANFYFKIGKNNAAVSVIERFNAIKKNKPTLELFSVYLDGLLQTGDLVKAKAVYEKLSSMPKRSLKVNISLINYCLKSGNIEKAADILVEAEKKYDNNVGLLLIKAGLLIYQEDFKSLDVVLDKVQKLEADKSPVYYSKYLEYRGMQSVAEQKVKRAIQYFKKALSINESTDLRAKLAVLDMSNDTEANLLIAESKAIKEITKAKNHIKNKNWNFAFVSAMEATRIAPNYVKAKLFLSDLQAKQSFFEESLKTLEDLFKKYPNDKDVIFALIQAYIEAYKFREAKRHLAMIVASDYRTDPEYYKVSAKYYLYKDDFNHAVGWLQQAINKNPLDDSLVFDLAKFFIRYNKFTKAKVLLNKAMDLDPSKIEYRISYADIIYEVDGAESAIGYLYDILNDFPDNPKVYSAIGIYYYKSGQLKYFEDTKEKLQKLPNKDEALYDFLIKAAKLDEKFEDVIKYSKKLIRINPANLDTRMFLGQVYLEKERYKEALREFKAVEERISTYPKLQYYMSKLYLLVDNNEKAIELAKNEIKANPTSEDGYILLGEIYRKEEKYIEAEKEYKKAQRINSKNVDTLVGLAFINYKKNQYEIALDLFTKAKNLDSQRAETYKLLGDVYRKIGQSDLAVESYKTFLDLSPDTKYREQLNSYIRMME